MNKIKNVFQNIYLHIKKIIEFILPDGILSDTKSILVFKRLLLFAFLLFILQGIMCILIVFIVVKSNGESFVLPDVEGNEVFKAFNILEKEGMNLNVQTHYFNNYPLGTIVSQEPKGGVKVKRGRTVYLVVNALEQNVIKMPNLIGIKYEEALSIISNNILNYMTNVVLLPRVEIIDDNYENNIVISQLPSPDDVVSINSEIILTVNKK